MRTQTFGVEVEMTGITRKGAAQVAADFFGTTAEYIGGGYDKYGAEDSSGRVWAFGSYPSNPDTRRPVKAEQETAIKRKAHHHLPF